VRVTGLVLPVSVHDGRQVGTRPLDPDTGLREPLDVGHREEIQPDTDPADAGSTVLVLRALNLGDLLVAVPALRALRAHYPKHVITLATSPALAPVVAATGAVDRLLPHRGLGPPPVRRPAVAVDLHGVLPDSVNALRATGPRRLVAFVSADAGHLDGPPVREREHERLRWCRLVTWIGARADPENLLLPAPGAGPRPGATVVHPGARYGSKRWPAERFATVAAALAAAGHDVVVTGSAGERPLAESVVAAAHLPPSAVLAGRTELEDLCALISTARLVVSGDTGVAHLASAYRRPSVVLFGPASPLIWGPPAAGPHIALWHGTGERETLVDVPDPALLAITVDEVLDACAAALRRSSNGDQ
jgi:ADP-heptose:LPS heptosyltransferase